MQTERWVAVAAWSTLAAGFTYAGLDYAGLLAIVLNAIGSTIGDGLAAIVAALGS
jgi:hypothetical protein